MTHVDSCPQHVPSPPPRPWNLEIAARLKMRLCHLATCRMPLGWQRHTHTKHVFI